MNQSLFGPKKLGFGMMRLPMRKNDGAPDTVDTDQVCRMVDRFLERGFCYFDTAHGYLDGQSETALRTCLTSRHPRHTYRLTNKLSGGFFKTEADIRPLFESQLAACGVETGKLHAALDELAAAALGDLCAPSNPRRPSAEDVRALLKELA